TVEKVRFDERVHVPVADVRRRPGVQTNPAVTGAHVVVLPQLLWDWNGVRDKVVSAPNRLEVAEPREPDESPKSERSAGAWDEVRAGEYPPRHEFLPLRVSDLCRWCYLHELRHTRRLTLFALPCFKPRRGVVRKWADANARLLVVAALIVVVR